MKQSKFRKYDEPNEQRFDHLAASLTYKSMQDVLTSKSSISSSEVFQLNKVDFHVKLFRGQIQERNQLQYLISIHPKQLTKEVEEWIVIINIRDTALMELVRKRVKQFKLIEQVLIIQDYSEECITIELQKILRKFEPRYRFIVFTDTIDAISDLQQLMLPYPYLIYFTENCLVDEISISPSIHHYSILTNLEEADIQQLIQFAMNSLMRLCYCDITVEILKSQANNTYSYFEVLGHPLCRHSHINTDYLTYSALVDTIAQVNPEETHKVIYRLPYLQANHTLYLPLSVTISDINKEHTKLGDIIIKDTTKSYSVKLMHNYDLIKPKASLFCRKYIFLMQQLYAFKEKITLQSSLYYSLQSEEGFYSIDEISFSKHGKYFQEFIANFGDRGDHLHLISEHLSQLSEIRDSMKKQILFTELQKAVLFALPSLNFLHQ